MDKQHTQQPVAWVRFRSDGCYEGPIMDSDSRMDGSRRTSGAWTPLYTAPPVPRAVLMAALWEFHRDFYPSHDRKNNELGLRISAIADCYASKVQPDVELVSYAPDMATCTLRIGDEQYLFDRHVDQPEPVNHQLLAALKPLVDGGHFDLTDSPKSLVSNIKRILSEASAIAAAEAVQPVVLDRATIRQIFMAHGFTIKDGQTDLKPYVYEAADALLRTQRPAIAAIGQNGNDGLHYQEQEGGNDGRA